MWRCAACTLDNEPAAVSCVACDNPRPPESSQGQGSTPVGTWRCEVCTLDNAPNLSECVACGAPRAQQSSPCSARTDTSGHTGSSSTNIWKCGLCTLENDVMSTTCVACGTARAGLDQRFHTSMTQPMSGSSSSASTATVPPLQQQTKPPGVSQPRPRENSPESKAGGPGTGGLGTGVGLGGAGGGAGGGARIWTCAMCHMENGVAGTKCLACGHPRPGFEPREEAPRASSAASAAPVFAGIVEPLEPFEVKENGRPELLPGEIELKVERGLYLYKKDERWMEDGAAIATSHRILWTWTPQQKPPVHLALPLRHVSDAPDRSAFMKTNKLCLLLRAHPDLFFQLGFPKGSRDEFGRVVRKALAAREWERPAAAGPAEPDSSKPRVHTGIGTLLEMQVKRDRATGAMLGEALGDLDGLMVHARELVAVAERMRATLAEAKRTTKEEDELLDDPDDDDDDLSAMLLQTGIVNPVSKAVVGVDHYHSELAAQLLDFLQPLLRQREGGGMDDGMSARGSARGQGRGMMTLTDLFCVYNRARGIEMVSPADLRKACELFEKKGYPLRLVSFPSGVLVVQPADSDEPSLSALLASYPAGLAAQDLANALGLSLALARNRLKAAEDAGEVCRDDSIEGLRFFPNRFATA